MRDKYLPIGTVVLLKGGIKRAMITGFCSVAQEDQEKIYDYSGCVYPEGYLSSNQVCLFDHDQIEKIFFLGYEDEEEVSFKQKLNKIVEEIEKENSTGVNVPEMTSVEESNEVLESSPVQDVNLANETLAPESQPTFNNNITTSSIQTDDTEIRPFAE